MIKKIVGVIVGLITGGIVNGLIVMISVLQNPMPEGLDPYSEDKTAMMDYVATLPTSAFVIVLLAHLFGAMVGGFICSVIVRHKWLLGFAIVGAVFLLGGIFNLVSIPHPTWFSITDLLIYIPSAVFGGLLGKSFWNSTDKRKTETETDNPISTT
jgi:hypothetical protein